MCVVSIILQTDRSHILLNSNARERAKGERERERGRGRGRKREKWHGMKTIHFPNGGENKRDFTTTYLNNNNGLQQGTQVTKSIDF